MSLQAIALISGVTGQDGSYLSELLLSKGYAVHGIVRRGSTINTKRVDHLIDKDNFELHYGDLGDANSLIRIIQKVTPDEIKSSIKSFAESSWEKHEKIKTLLLGD